MFDFYLLLKLSFGLLYSFLPNNLKRIKDSVNAHIYIHIKKSALNIHWRTHAEAEAPILWPPDAKNWLIGKDPDAGKDWRQEEKGMTEDEMVGRHHRLNGHEYEQAPGVSDWQGSLACCSSWGRKELDMTEQLNWIESVFIEGMNEWV